MKIQRRDILEKEYLIDEGIVTVVVVVDAAAHSHFVVEHLGVEAK